MRRVLITLLLLLAALPGCSGIARKSATPEPAYPSYGQRLDTLAARAKADPRISALIDNMMVNALEIADRPIVRRVYKYEDIGKYRTKLDGRAKPMETPRQEVFALSMSDSFANGTVAGELPTLAAAARLRGDKKCLGRVLEQLEEMTTWSPLQRPGWSLLGPGQRLPEGGDGNWLGTGSGVRAIANTLETLPPGAMSAGLRDKLNTLLDKEIASISGDWRDKRPWFIRLDNAITNQWVLPTEGLVRACLAVGKDKHPAEYELGVANLLKAMNAHGSQGEFEEGIGYASMTVISMASAARAMAEAGDLRAIQHPFLPRFTSWAIQHMQPAGHTINCFNGGAVFNTDLRSLLTQMAGQLGSVEARWVVDNVTSGPTNDLQGLFYRALPPAALTPPPTFAAYERATRVNWRGGWDDSATGVWVRGGHELDQHDNVDRGHVNMSANGKLILILAGCPSYDNPRCHSYYTTGCGHNVLQIGEAMTPVDNVGKTQPAGWQKRQAIAPITVSRLDAQGGDVTVDVTRGYNGLDEWKRRAAWDAKTLVVNDTVRLEEGKKDVLLFRWHLGAEKGVSIEKAEGGYKARWADAEITFQADTPLSVTQEKALDITTNGRDKGEHEHVCLILKTAGKKNALKLETKVTVK